MNERKRSLEKIEELKGQIWEINKNRPVEASGDKIVNNIKKLLEGDKNSEIIETIKKIPNGEKWQDMNIEKNRT